MRIFLRAVDIALSSHLSSSVLLLKSWKELPFGPYHTAREEAVPPQTIQQKVSLLITGT